jgi:hypothetical protein
MNQELSENVNSKDTNREDTFASNNGLLLQTVDQQSYRDSLHGRRLMTLFGDVFSDSCNKETGKSFLVQTPALPFENRSRSTSEFDWGFILFFVFLLLLAFIKANFLKPLKTSYKILTNGTYNQNTSKPELIYPYFSIFPLIVCSWIIFSFILYTFICQSIDRSGNIILLWSFIFSLIFFIIRFFLLKLVGVLFDMKNAISEVKYLTKMINFIIALLTFPFIFINYYYSFPFFLIFVALIFVGLFIYRVLLGWNFLKQKFRIHEYFLYLCTIEILPVLILLKFILNELLVS